MKKINFHGANHQLGAPAGWDKDKSLPPCDTLPVMVSAVGSCTTFTSFWKPSPEDLVMLGNGAKIRLDVYGQMHPPVRVSVEAATEIEDAPPRKLTDGEG